MSLKLVPQQNKETESATAMGHRDITSRIYCPQSDLSRTENWGAVCVCKAVQETVAPNLPTADNSKDRALKIMSGQTQTTQAGLSLR